MAAGFDGRSAGVQELTDNYDNPIVRLTLNAPAAVLAPLFAADAIDSACTAGTLSCSIKAVRGRPSIRFTSDAAKSLDKKILATASALCATIGGEWHVFHAFDITPVIAASTEAMTMPMASPIVRNQRRDERRAHGRGSRAD
jgi:hypothetical protein